MSLTDPSGHVFRAERKRGDQWYAKYRLPDGRQVQRKIGPVWTGRGRPAAGHYTKRGAEAWLRDTLDQARKGTLQGMVRTEVSFAKAAEEWLRYIEHDRGRKPSTVVGYRNLVRSQLLPAFATKQIETITTPMIEAWLANVDRAPSTRQKSLVLLHGIFQRARKVYGLAVNPAADVEKPTLRRSGDIEVFSPEEIMALVRAAASQQDAALFLTAALTGLRRGELVALRWRDVDFPRRTIRVRAGYVEGQLTTPKSGKVRSVPIAPDVQVALSQLGQRQDWVGDDDLVFPGTDGGYLDASALRRRYTAALKRAELRPLRFHDLRHTFGTRMIGKADIRRVQEWMGHADVQTTMKYLHYVPRDDDAELVAAAFAIEVPVQPSSETSQPAISQRR